MESIEDYRAILTAMSAGVEEFEMKINEVIHHCRRCDKTIRDFNDLWLCEDCEASEGPVTPT